jgi:hypothetical protein
LTRLRRAACLRSSERSPDRRHFGREAERLHVERLAYPRQLRLSAGDRRCRRQRSGRSRFRVRLQPDGVSLRRRAHHGVRKSHRRQRPGRSRDRISLGEFGPRSRREKEENPWFFADAAEAIAAEEIQRARTLDRHLEEQVRHQLSDLLKRIEALPDEVAATVLIEFLQDAEQLLQTCVAVRSPDWEVCDSIGSIRGAVNDDLARTVQGQPSLEAARRSVDEQFPIIAGIGVARALSPLINHPGDPIPREEALSALLAESPPNVSLMLYLAKQTNDSSEYIEVRASFSTLLELARESGLPRDRYAELREV